MTIGFRILPRARAVPPQLVERFAALPVANVSDVMGRLSAGGPRLRAVHNLGPRMTGPAITVRTRPGDNLMVHKAIDVASPGDVIVVDAGGDLTNAIIGDIMTSLAKSRGLAGFVINGAVRDADDIRTGGLPVYAAGVTHRGPYKDGPGELNTAIALHGMVVNPGDLMLGDGDGVLAVPYDAAEAVLADAEAKQTTEARELADIAAGALDRSWIDRTLRAKGCVGLSNAAA